MKVVRERLAEVGGALLGTHFRLAVMGGQIVVCALGANCTHPYRPRDGLGRFFGMKFHTTRKKPSKHGWLCKEEWLPVDPKFPGQNLVCVQCKRVAKNSADALSQREKRNKDKRRRLAEATTVGEGHRVMVGQSTEATAAATSEVSQDEIKVSAAATPEVSQDEIKVSPSEIKEVQEEFRQRLSRGPEAGALEEEEEEEEESVSLSLGDISDSSQDPISSSSVVQPSWNADSTQESQESRGDPISSNSVDPVGNADPISSSDDESAPPTQEATIPEDASLSLGYISDDDKPGGPNFLQNSWRSPAERCFRTRKGIVHHVRPLCPGCKMLVDEGRVDPRREKRYFYEREDYACKPAQAAPLPASPLPAAPLPRNERGREEPSRFHSSAHSTSNRLSTGAADWQDLRSEVFAEAESIMPFGAVDNDGIWCAHPECQKVLFLRSEDIPTSLTIGEAGVMHCAHIASHASIGHKSNHINNLMPTCAEHNKGHGNQFDQWAARWHFGPDGATSKIGYFKYYYSKGAK
eukprot:COSAG05_NODE_3_length_51333_cov_129.132080_27_plen_522_part_00